MVTSTILGPDGKPFNTAELAEPQTAQLTSLQHEWQGHPTRGLTPSRLATIMDSAEQGDLIAQCDLYDDMEEKDAHIAAEMGKRRRAITQLDWDVVAPPSPYAAEKRAAKQVREWLKDLGGFEDMLFDITDAIGKGYCCLELEWERVEGVWLPKTITHRPQSWFTLYRGYVEEIRLRTGGSDGEPLQPFGWIVHTHKAKSGWLARSALFRVLAWPFLFKNYSVADLAEFLEIYGLPIRIGKYPPGAGEKEKMTLLRALAGVGHRASGIMPAGMDVDFQDATTGDADAFQLMIDWCERSQSKAILGGTLTSQADGKTSTNALGNVHNEVRKDLRDADCKQIAATLTHDLAYAIAALNGLAPNGPKRAPRFSFDVQETEDIATYSTALPSLLGTGMKIPRKWAQEKLGIPEPEDDDDDLLALPAAAKPAIAPKVDETLVNQAAATAAVSPAPIAQAGDPAEQMTDQLDKTMAPHVDQWVAQIRALAAKAHSLDELREGLLKLAPELSLDEYARAMTEALTAAALAGRYEVLQEAAR